MQSVPHPQVRILRLEVNRLIDDFTREAIESAGDFALVEEAGSRAIEKMRTILMTSGLTLSAAHSSREYRCPSCTEPLHAWAAGQRRVVTAEGDGSYHVVRYRCLACQTDHYPLEEINGLAGSQFTTGAKAAIAEEASEKAFGPAAVALARTRGIGVSAKEVDRTIREVADWRKKEEDELTGALFGEEAHLARLVNPEVDPLAQAPPLHSFLDWQKETPGLISVDGAMLRSPEKGPEGLEWFECRGAVIAPAPDRARGQKVYLGGVCSPDDLFDLVRAAWCKGGNTRRPCLFVADGARWIWDRVRYYFPEAIQVLDLYHAAEHVASAAMACWGEEDERSHEWRRRAREMLLESGGPQRILRTLIRELRNPAQVACPDELQKELRYLLNHRHRMKYAWLKAYGLPVASGAMESAIKQLSTQRLRQSGMKWTRPGADSVLRVRAARMSNSLSGTIQRRRISLQTATQAKYTVVKTL